MDSKVNLILNLLRASVLLNRTGLKLVEGTAIASVQQWQLLGIIAENEGICLSKLCEDTLVTKQNITGLVDRMRRAGMIEAWSDPEDKRMTRLRLTPDGARTLEEIRPRAEASNEAMLEAFSEEELGRFDEMVQRLVRSLRAQSGA
ncbi:MULTISPECIES: MarR family winged helix-turn-helix transcriptional regulator [Paenibacillus]|uniref:MarR family winged helix-turn-helix transcriptional regulator n=1 Tax=Paenibacillus TaxID=44249 RepID=UPI0022B876E7|nr:MarR family transcriptional regulator [Paenibacillus caseinilyticus]MCZ8521762.1 MarR family transcriptional regulator [Paenibacillus caseinilyticus]